MPVKLPRAVSGTALRRANALFLMSISVASAAAYEGCSSDDDPPTDAGAAEAGTPDVTSPGADSGGGADVTIPKDSGPDTAVFLDVATSDVVDAGPDVFDAAIDCSGDLAGDGLPTHLECTGLYSDWPSKTIASNLIPFTPAYKLWSDGAVKSRWIYIPPGEKIDNSNLDEWTFPLGTKTFKEFRLGVQRIETRMFVKTASGWKPTTYRWSDDELTAVKLDTGETNVNDAGYQIPTQAQCLMCHGGRLDKVLGFDAINLGAAASAPASLTSLQAQNLFTNPMPNTFEIPEDTTGLAKTPVGWLHSNCGVACHNQNPVSLAFNSHLYMRVSATDIGADAGGIRVRDLDTWKTAVNQTPISFNQFNGQGYSRIKPGDVSKSLIPLLDEWRGDASIPQMPPIISHVSPTSDVNALKAWITAMPDGG